VSTRDLDRGSVWFGEINDQLKDTTVGIICLTQENKNRPWILFEAGALIKGLSSSRVCTLLVDLAPKDIEDPLAQFNHTFPNRESMRALVDTLNNQMGSNGLDHRTLDTVFDTYWGQFEASFHKILHEIVPGEEAMPRKDSDILAEILANTRQLSSRVSRLESRRIEDEERAIMRRVSGPGEAAELIRNFAEVGMPESIILDRMEEHGVPREFVRENLRGFRINERAAESAKKETR
jgi:hypothetical protein